MEFWKDIEGYEGLYQISNKGNVRSLNYNHTGKTKILKFNQSNKGYLSVMLCKDGKHKRYFVHRLVALAFIPNPNHYTQVNHKDENPSNNCIENLEWCDAKYNANYGTRNERMAKTLSKPVLQIDKNTNEVIRVWDSIIDVEREKGYYHSHISACCLHKRGYYSAYGYKWKFE